MRKRLLALLLTVLMVVGLLPLTLFALEETGAGVSESGSPVTQTKPENRTLNEIKTEVNKAKMNLALYQSFQGWQFSEGATEYALPQSTAVQSITANADYNSYNESMLAVKNGKAAFSIVTEEDGNVALYVGNAEKQASDNDNFVDAGFDVPRTFENQIGNGTHDLYIGADFKMNGPNINSCLPSTLIGIVYRVNSGGATLLSLVTVSDIGGLYVGNRADPDKLIGFLCDTEYTRIAVMINRAENRYYVYVNDILVNPEGALLFTDDIVDNMNSNNTVNSAVYTAQNLPISNVRMCLIDANVDVDVHKGLFIDNFICANRISVKKSEAKALDVFTSDFSGCTAGTNATLPLPGTTTRAYGVFWPGAVKYFKEDDGSVAMQWHQTAKDDSTALDQAYFQINNAAPKGSNLRFSIELRLGEDGALGSQSFIFFRSDMNVTLNGIRDDSFRVALASDGKLTFAGAPIGTLSKEKYSNLTIDFVCNTVAGGVIALFYFDGELVHTASVNFHYRVEYASWEYHPSLVRIYPIYDNVVEQLKKNDLKLRAVSLTVTEDYNMPLSAGSIFTKTPVGFVKNAGITRYYEEDGSYKTEDFKLDGVKYLVGDSGCIIGKASDGVMFSPYAPYVDWTHVSDPSYSETPIFSSPAGALLNGNDGGSSTVRPVRDAFETAVVIPKTGEQARLYTSYYDYGPSTIVSNDPNSYVMWGIPSDKRINTSLVLDFDLMMAQEKSLNDKFEAYNTFFNFVGRENPDGSGNRADTRFLKLSSDGWLSHNGKKLVKINKTEFTRLSVVIHTPSDGEANGSLDLYANGVLLLEGIKMSASARNIEAIRFFCAFDQDIAYYVKDVYLYESEGPQQFYTMREGEPVLTNDKFASPARPSDIKQGFVQEDGVIRYYGDDGFPKTDVTFTANDGKEYTADANGVIEELGVYTLTFKADGKVVEEVEFSSLTSKIKEPDVPLKQCHTGVWERYTLGNESITVNAIYTLSHSDLSRVGAQEPTCSSSGNIEYYACTGCDKFFSDNNGTVEITDKSSVILPIVDCVIVNCACKWCGTVAHAIVYSPRVEPKCNAVGNIEYFSCADCDKYFSDIRGQNEIVDKSSVILPKVDHVYVGGACKWCGAAVHSLSHCDRVEPKCNATGNIEYYFCADCGKFFSDSEGENEIADKNSVVIPKVDHVYVGGACKWCGALDEATNSVSSSYYATSLTLGNKIGVVFYLDIVNATGAQVEIGLNKDFASGIAVRKSVGELKTEVIGGKTYYKVEYSVYPADICSDVTVKVLTPSGAVENEYVSSAVRYAMAVQTAPTGGIYTKELKGLAKAIIALGRNAAAVYANGAAAEIIEDALVDWKNVASMEVSVSKDNAIKFKNVSFDMEKFIIRVEVTVDKSINANKHKFKIGNKNIAAAQVDDTTWVVEQKIAAIKLNDVITFSVSADNSYVNVKLSALTPIKALLMVPGFAADTKNLIKATKLYLDALTEYAE